MSNKTPTPIQQLIDELELLQSRVSGFEKSKQFALRLTIKIAKSKLPAERKFAEECFDSGSEFGRESYFYEQEWSSYEAYSKTPDFSTFYKNNYEDGK